MKSRMFTYCCLLLLSLPLLFACQSETVEIKRVPMETSELFSQKEIDQAIETTIDYVDRQFDYCQLISLGYAGDDEEWFDSWAEQYGADQVIILTSSFRVDENAEQTGFEPGATHTGWNWILTRKGSGKWTVSGYGY